MAERLPFLFISILLTASAHAASSEVGWGETEAGTGPSLSADQRQRCRDLEIGKPKQVTLSRDQAAGLPARYQVTRTADKTYRVDLNVHFGPNEFFGEKEKFRKGTATLPEYVERVDRHYREEMKKCLASMNPKLVDAGGTKIELRINDKFMEPTHFNGESNFIEIGPRKFNGEGHLTRASKRVYTSNIDCSTMIHELMHNLGLCDEYAEHSFAKPDSAGTPRRLYNCRALGPKGSVMNNSALSLAGLTKGPPIKPAHIRAIIFGGCESRNKLYYSCAKHAYTTADPGQCPAMPEECKDPQQWLR
jgi:hypothetical protein